MLQGLVCRKINKNTTVYRAFSFIITSCNLLGHPSVSSSKHGQGQQTRFARNCCPNHLTSPLVVHARKSDDKLKGFPYSCYFPAFLFCLHSACIPSMLFVPLEVFFRLLTIVGISFTFWAHNTMKLFTSQIDLQKTWHAYNPEVCSYLHIFILTELIVPYFVCINLSCRFPLDNPIAANITGPFLAYGYGTMAHLLLWYRTFPIEGWHQAKPEISGVKTSELSKEKKERGYPIYKFYRTKIFKSLYVS